jgi:hypothetical protein
MRDMAAIWLFCVCACSIAPDDAIEREDIDRDGGGDAPGSILLPEGDEGAPAGCFAEPPPDALSPPAPPPVTVPATRILYLHRDGGTYRPGDDDSSADESSLLGHATTIPAHASPAPWADVLACVRSAFSRWKVNVTDQDPGSETHLEAVVGGLPSLLGLPAAVGGVAQLPYVAPDGGPLVNERAVVFVFSAHPAHASAAVLCRSIAHELGHALSLDHVTRCDDIMSYGQCGPLSFTEGESECGTDSPRECFTSNTQATRARLDYLLGRKNGKAPQNQAPFVKLFSPGNGEHVAAGDSLDALARIWDDGAVAAPEIWWKDGAGKRLFPLTPTGTDNQYGATIAVDAGASGTVKIRAQALDDDGVGSSSPKRNVVIE